MAKPPIPRPDYSRAGVNRDRPERLPTEGPVLRRALARAGAATSTDLASLESSLTVVEDDVEAAEVSIDDLVTAFVDHVAAADPHTGYQKESEKGNANGYAGLDGTGKVPSAQLPAAAPGSAVAIELSDNLTIPTNTVLCTATLLDLATKELTIEGTGILDIA